MPRRHRLTITAVTIKAITTSQNTNAVQFNILPLALTRGGILDSNRSRPSPIAWPSPRAPMKARIVHLTHSFQSLPEPEIIIERLRFTRLSSVRPRLLTISLSERDVTNGREDSEIPSSARQGSVRWSEVKGRCRALVDIVRLHASLPLKHFQLFMRVRVTQCLRNTKPVSRPSGIMPIKVASGEVIGSFGAPSSGSAFVPVTRSIEVSCNAVTIVVDVSQVDLCL